MKRMLTDKMNLVLTQLSDLLELCSEDLDCGYRSKPTVVCSHDEMGTMRTKRDVLHEMGAMMVKRDVPKNIGHSVYTIHLDIQLPEDS